MTNRPPKRRPPMDDSRPSWVDAQGYIACRHLDGDEWLITRQMIGAVQLAVCTPPPDGGILEFWDYPTTANGFVALAAAFHAFPRRDEFTEDWERHHVAATGEDRRQQGARPTSYCYLNIEKDDDSWYVGTCDCGEWATPIGCPGYEEVANAWGDHLAHWSTPRIGFGFGLFIDGHASAASDGDDDHGQQGEDG